MNCTPTSLKARCVNKWRFTRDRASCLRGASRCSTPSEWPQNQKINHPRHREMDTSRVDGVKAPLDDGTPRSHGLAVRRDVRALLRGPAVS